MDEAVSRPGRRPLVDTYLTEVRLLAEGLCPDARVEVTTESYEDEDGHVRIYPPAGFNQTQVAALEGTIAERCVDILLETGVFLCTAVYEANE